MKNIRKIKSKLSLNHTIFWYHFLKLRIKYKAAFTTETVYTSLNVVSLFLALKYRSILSSLRKYFLSTPITYDGAVVESTSDKRCIKFGYDSILSFGYLHYQNYRQNELLLCTLNSPRGYIFKCLCMILCIKSVL